MQALLSDTQSGTDALAQAELRCVLRKQRLATKARDVDRARLLERQRIARAVLALQACFRWVR